MDRISFLLYFSCLYFLFSSYFICIMLYLLLLLVGSSSACAVYFNITRPLVSWECYYRTGQQKGSGGKKGPSMHQRRLLRCSSYSLVFTLSPPLLLLLLLCCCLLFFSVMIFERLHSLAVCLLFHTIAVADPLSSLYTAALNSLSSDRFPIILRANALVQGPHTTHTIM